MTTPILHGPTFSTYVRTVRLTLREKGVAYDQDKFDITQGCPTEQRARHPFGKVPALTHGEFCLYETFAICRYIDEAFDGPALQPDDPRDRARMTQIIQVMDNYAVSTAAGQIILQRILMPILGREPNEDIIAAALPKAQKAFTVLNGFIGSGSHLVGGAISLADLHLIPNYHYFLQTPEGRAIAETSPGLCRWWDGMQTRPSVTETEA